jgi:hypothetical protein
MAEVRTLAEGSMRWVQGSGSGQSWATASAPVSGLAGYVQSMTIASARTVKAMMDRGTAIHQKITEIAPVEVNMTYLWTGHYPNATTASGASVPMMHLEYKAIEPENGGSGRYVQLHGAVLNSRQITEGKDGTTIQDKYTCIGMNGPTASGYLG